MNSTSGPKYILSEICCCHTMSRGLIDCHWYDWTNRDQWICKGVDEITVTFLVCTFPILSFYCIVHQLYTFTPPALNHKAVLTALHRFNPPRSRFKENVTDELLGEVDMCLYESTYRSHFYIKILFGVFPCSKVSCLTLYLISFHRSFHTSKYYGDFVLCLGNARTCKVT